MAELTYYDILQVHPSASEDAIRAAYFRLAKIYHPDLRRQDQRPEDTERFIEINRAYTVLLDPARRQTYDLDLQDRGAPRQADGAANAAAIETPADDGEPRPATAAPRPWAGQGEAGRAFIKAEQLVDEGRVKDAARLLLALVRVEPDNPGYLSLAGYALAKAGENLHKARDFCRRSFEMEPYNATYCARLGYVYVAAGLPKLAEKIFADALKLDPAQPLARQYAGRAQASVPSGGLMTQLKGLLSR